LFLIFYAVGTFHDNDVLPMTIGAACLFILDYVARAIWGSVIPMRSTYLKTKGDVVQIRFQKHLLARILRLHKIGQYMFINFPSISPLEWHPFSISSGPDEVEIEVNIKGLGDHTKKLVEYAHQSQFLWVRTDGPYGDPKFNYRRFPVLFLCAGGIGITPIIGILKDAYRFGVIDSMAKKTHKSVLEKIVLVWTVATAEQSNWFSEELAWFQNAAKSENFPNLEVSIYVSKGTAAEPMIQGRPNFETILEKLVNSNQAKATNVFTCGPRKLVNNCWDGVNMWHRQGHPFKFHHECFEF